MSRRSRRRGLRAAAGCLVAASLVVSTPQLQAQAAPKPDPRKSVWTPRAEKPVPIKAITPVPRGADPDDRYLAGRPATSWPAAGRAEVEVPRPVAPATNWKGLVDGRPAPDLAPRAKAGNLPIALGPTAAANAAVARSAKAPATPNKVEVQLLERRDNGLRLTLRRTDGVTAAGKVSLRLDYSAFAGMFGGDWATRLQVVDPVSGQTVATRNDGSGMLSADVPVTAQAKEFAVVAAASGPAGDATTTPLNASATWQAGGSSGDFTWNYPMKTPPGVSGPTPEVALSYSSGSVDGRTTNANSQSSWVGAGFELAPGGAIERKYASCAGKSEQASGNENNAPKAVGDLCWATDNATFSLSGSGGELVQDDVTGTWHPRNDEGVTVQRLTLTEGSNGDDGPAAGAGAKGEYWVLTDRSGTKYYFGLNNLPGSATATNSVWTVPVFGNNKNEPCHQSAYAASYCQQAYKWNLDYVVDTNGNTMRYFYDVETNKYGRAGTKTQVSTYTRAGNVRLIEYGQRTGSGAGTDKPIARVSFGTGDRCTKTSACAPADYVDSPLDQECTSTTSCDNLYPTFWTKKRLTGVTTEINGPAGFSPVTRWTPRYGWLSPNDGRSPLLWLQGITQTGLVGGTKSVPEITFDSVMKANRIIGPGDGLPAMNWPRIRTVTYDTGGQIQVNYLEPDCSLPGNVPAPDANDKRCHPIKWTPDGQAERQDWFGKYVVSSVLESDQVSGLTPIATEYSYPNPPAWRHDDEDGLVEVGEKTWSQWRGYDEVKVTKGNSAGPRSVTVSRYFRGMDGDKTAAGGTKSVAITDSTGGRWIDSNPLAGMQREQTTFSGDTVVARSLTDPWISEPTATRTRPWGTTQSFQIQERAVNEAQVAGSGWRKTSTRNEFTASGQLQWTSDKADEATPSDDTCTRYEYFSNPARGIVDLPSRKQVVDVACDQAWTKDDVIADEKQVIDPQTGATTATQRIAGFDAAGAPTYQTTSTTTYDDYGRPKTATDVANKQTEMTYTPAAGPVTKVTTKQPNGLTSSSIVEPAWGEEVAVVDQGGRQTDTKRDPLGRVLSTYLPGQDRNGTASARYEYSDVSGRPSVTKVSTLQADDTVSDSYQLLDGLGRVRQLQKPSSDGVGWVITDYVYDSRGLKTEENGPYYVESRPSSNLVLAPQAATDIQAQRVTQYDDQGRPSAEKFYVSGVLQWTTTHANATGVETIDPPSGEQATTRISDAKGRLTELRQYRSDTPTGLYDTTKYTYAPSGQLATVVDAAGNKWQYDYDLRGRKIKDTEPDRGVTSYTYDDRDRMTSSTDQRGVKLSYTYDDGGRRTAEYLGEVADGKLQAEWKYDKLASGSLAAGSLTSATRYVNGQPYTLRTTGFDAHGKPTGTELVLPSTEGKLAEQTYQVGMTYTADGKDKTVTVPAVGGLPAETLTTTYSDQGLATGLSGADDYVIDSKYTPYGELTEMSLTQGSNWLQQQFEYEKGTRRLTRTGVVTPNELVQDVEYAYDTAGNITKLKDTPGASTGEAADVQCFQYDQSRQLTQAWTPNADDCATAPTTAKLGGPAPYWHSWTFDAIGNRKTETRKTAAGTTQSTYTYAATKPHQVGQVAIKGPGVDKTDSYSYDEIGGQKAAPGQTMTWDAEGHVESVTTNGKKTSFLYDADGNRLLRYDGTGTTLYFGQHELLLKPTGELVGTRYYAFAGQTIGVRTGARLMWVATDHHGTINLSVDPSSLVVTRRRTTPYGEIRGAVPTAWPGQRGFVGGTEDPSGLVHLGAREYNPSLGKFISVDPVVDPSEPNQLNAYTYANNSPVTFSDADGQRWVMDTVTQLKIVVRAITKRIVEYKRELIKVTVRSMVAGALAAMAAALGNFALAAALNGYRTYYVAQIKRIVRIVTELVRQVIKITKVIRRFDPMGEVDDAVKEAMAAAQDVYRIAARVMADAKSPAPGWDPTKEILDWLKKRNDSEKSFWKGLWGDEEFMHYQKDGPRDKDWDEGWFFGLGAGLTGLIGGAGGAIAGVAGGLQFLGAWNDSHDKQGNFHPLRVLPWLGPALPMLAGKWAGQAIVKGLGGRWWPVPGLPFKVKFGN